MVKFVIFTKILNKNKWDIKKLLGFKELLLFLAFLTSEKFSHYPCSVFLDESSAEQLT